MMAVSRSLERARATRSGFTLIELLIVVAIIALLISILLPSLSMARQQAKRVVCQSNLRQLMTAWYTYTVENRDRIVNGNTGTNIQGTPASTGEDCWVGFSGQMGFGGMIPDESPEQQLRNIRLGALWDYTKMEDLYRCPTALPEVMRNYSIVDRLNGWDPNLDNERTVRVTTAIKYTSRQLAFVDDGPQTAHSWTSYWDQPAWMEPVTTRHTDGSTFAFADGHVEHWKWTHPNTKKIGALTMEEYLMETRFQWYYPAGQDNEDLYRIQRGAWGELEYELGGNQITP